MIRCKLSIAVNRNRRIIKSRNNIRDLPKVSGESAKYWENKFIDSLSTSVEIQKQYNKLESEIKLLLTQLPRNKKEEKKLISQETKYLLDRRKSLYKGKRNKEKQSEITKLSKEINRNISHEKKKKRQKIFEKFISRTGALRKAYKELSDKSEWAVKLKNRRGKSAELFVNCLEAMVETCLPGGDEALPRAPPPDPDHPDVPEPR
ncbi:Endonuclease-reverse transcriptase [Operophtera brumata]|uniref:Endonuclease-reverse transcriptase n=1 Tax=Operophtera brumata TaxID=104452 RepID=A0A0L7LFD0_OPEBR|nr:Endonuclease-reverse transcriptase [Operophtera brumata]